MDAGPASVKSTTCSFDRQTFTRKSDSYRERADAGFWGWSVGGLPRWSWRVDNPMPASLSAEPRRHTAHPGTRAARPTPFCAGVAGVIRLRHSGAPYLRSQSHGVPRGPRNVVNGSLTLPLLLMQTRGGRYRGLGSPSRRQALSSSSRRQLVLLGAHLGPATTQHCLTRVPRSSQTQRLLRSADHLRDRRARSHTSQVSSTPT
jgi:hypothetical protein